MKRTEQNAWKYAISLWLLWLTVGILSFTCLSCAQPWQATDFTSQGVQVLIPESLSEQVSVQQVDIVVQQAVHAYAKMMGMSDYAVEDTVFGAKIQFVPRHTKCVDGTRTCYGAYWRPEYIQVYIWPEMECITSSAVAHELMHLFQWKVERYLDGGHTEPSVWGSFRGAALMDAYISSTAILCDKE